MRPIPCANVKKRPVDRQNMTYALMYLTLWVRPKRRPFFQVLEGDVSPPCLSFPSLPEYRRVGRGGGLLMVSVP